MVNKNNASGTHSHDEFLSEHLQLQEVAVAQLKMSTSSIVSHAGSGQEIKSYYSETELSLVSTLIIYIHTNTVCVRVCVCVCVCVCI